MAKAVAVKGQRGFGGGGAGRARGTPNKRTVELRAALEALGMGSAATPNFLLCRVETKPVRSRIRYV